MAHPATPHLSLLTAYRGRAAHLELLLAWPSRIRQSEGFVDFELILAEGAERPTAEATAAAHGDWVRHLHVLMPGTFHKAGRDPAMVATNRRRFAERRRANFPKPAP